MYIVHQLVTAHGGTLDVTSRFRIGAGAGYLFNNIASGTDDRFVSSERIYSDPGFTAQSNFLRTGAFVQYDTRDFPAGPRSGGNYIAQWHHFNDRSLGRFSFERLDLEAQRYIPLFNKRRVIALRAKSISSMLLEPCRGGRDVRISYSVAPSK